MSLLEVLTALAIFFISAASLLQMVDAASNSATYARRLAKAQLLAETKMDEVVAGVLPLQNGGGKIEEEIEGWNYSVTVNPESWTTVQDASTNQSITGLSSVIVTVNFQVSGVQPVEYSISRLILDPKLRQPAPQPTSTGVAP
jgi:type II secretion system protein I